MKMVTGVGGVSGAGNHSALLTLDRPIPAEPSFHTCREYWPRSRILATVVCGLLICLFTFYSPGLKSGLYFVFAVLGWNPRASGVLGKYISTEQHPSCCLSPHPQTNKWQWPAKAQIFPLGPFQSPSPTHISDPGEKTSPDEFHFMYLTLFWWHWVWIT
jgi:hypothetical protein